MSQLPAIAAKTFSGRPSLAVLSILLIGSAAIGLVPGAVAAQQSPEHEARLAAVYFRLEEGADVGSGPLSEIGASRPASYRAFTVISGDETERIAPLPGSIGIRMAAADAMAVTAQVGAERIGHQDSDYGNAVADALGAPRVDRFLRTTELPDGKAPAVDLNFEEALSTSDYLLIQESGGDAAVIVTPVDETGALLGPSVEVAGRYQWDTGRSDIDGTPLWASVIPVPPTTDGSPTQAIRIEARNAQLKVLALSELDDSEAPRPAPAQEADVSQAEAAATASQDSPRPGPALVEDSSAAVNSLSAAAVASGGVAGAANEVQTPAALAMTGPATDPWMMTIVAMGLIFFGWTIVLALRQRDDGNGGGHDRLDALGFD